MHILIFSDKDTTVWWKLKTFFVGRSGTLRLTTVIIFMWFYLVSVDLFSSLDDPNWVVCEFVYFPGLIVRLFERCIHLNIVFCIYIYLPCSYQVDLEMLSHVCGWLSVTFIFIMKLFKWNSIIARTWLLYGNVMCHNL